MKKFLLDILSDKALMNDFKANLEKRFSKVFML